MSPAPSLHRFGDAEFDEARFELRVSGQVRPTQRKALELLAVLLATPGQIVVKATLLDTLWGGRNVVEAVLPNAAAKLRAALGAVHATHIVTVPGKGYRFEGEVERIALGRTRSASPAAAALAPGTVVPGRAGHRLRRRLGTHPQSDTWLAEQPRSGDRRVFKFAFDGERLAGLKREWTLSRVLRRALGERADLVRVLDCRFDEAPYWLECEFGGEGLDAWADAPVGASTRLGALEQHGRIELLARVADALAAAHSASVLHLDLKPANVLVAESPGGATAVRLTDFGSGRLRDPAQLERLRVTRLGLSVHGGSSDSGTPYYIAPERLTGAKSTPGTSADLFALGVMLFQLVVADLRRPLAPGWEREIDDALLREDIALSTDIDPAHRLASAALLAHRLRSLPQRHAARDALELAEQRARLEAEAADLRRRHEEAEAMSLVLREDFIDAANPGLDGRADLTVAEALRRSAARIDERFAAASSRVRAQLHVTMQQSLSQLSHAVEAVQAGRRAEAALLQSLQPVAGQDASRGQPDELELRRQLHDTRLRLALDLVQLSLLDEARDTLAAMDNALADPGLQGFAQDRVVRARLLFVRSWLYAAEGEMSAAVTLGEKAFALVADLDESRARGRDAIVSSLADNLCIVGRYDEAEPLYRRLFEEQRQRHGEEHPRALYTLVGLGQVVGRLGRVEEGLALLRRCEDGLTRTLGPGHRHTLTALDQQAELLLRADRPRDALDAWERVQPGFEALMGAGSSYVLTVQANRALARQALGEHAEAAVLLEDALAKVRRFNVENAPQVQQLRFALAVSRLELGDASEARALVHGLQPTALALAQPEPDWPERLERLAAHLDQAGQGQAAGR